jgi:RNase P protein component
MLEIGLAILAGGRKMAVDRHLVRRRVCAICRKWPRRRCRD